MPSAKHSKYHYVYVLERQDDRRRFIGYTEDLKKRFAGRAAPAKGKQAASKKAATETRFRLVYIECSLDADDAHRRVKYLKTAAGKKYLAARLKAYAKRSG
jgi:putative endonuclease